MRFRTVLAAPLVAAVAVVSVPLPATALGDAITLAEMVVNQGDTQAAGACSFVASGPSLDPSSTPFHLVGYATVRSSKVVVSTSIRCRIRRQADHTQVGAALKQAAPGSSVSVVGDVRVDADGPYEICTWIDAVFADTSQLNPAGLEQCRTVANPLNVLAEHSIDLSGLVHYVLEGLVQPPPPPPDM